jgi:hypothetical protein
MGSSSSSKRERELADQNRQAQAQLAQTTAAYQPSPLEQRLEKDSTDWLDFVEGKNGPVDYTKAPGLVHLGMYDEAAANRFAERSATGGLQMGRDGANPTAVALRKEQLAAQMGEARGKDLVDAVRAKDASVRGNLAPFLIGTGEGRNQAKLGAASSQANSARQAYASTPVSTPWWQTALMGGLGAVGSWASAGFKM